MELADIRDCVQRGAFFVTDHAIAEGFKEGISVSDMMKVILSGEIVEVMRSAAAASSWAATTRGFRSISW